MRTGGERLWASSGWWVVGDVGVHIRSRWYIRLQQQPQQRVMGYRVRVFVPVLNAAGLTNTDAVGLWSLKINGVPCGPAERARPSPKCEAPRLRQREGQFTHQWYVDGFHIRPQ